MLVFFIALVLFFVFLFHLYVNGLIKHQQKRNDFLQLELMKEQSELNRINDIDKQQIEIKKQLNFIFGLRNSNYQVVRLFNELLAVVPDSVSLNKIVRQNNSIVILGKAASNLQITLFMKNIEKSDFFKQPVLTEITGKENMAGNERYFQLKVEQ